MVTLTFDQRVARNTQRLTKAFKEFENSPTTELLDGIIHVFATQQAEIEMLRLQVAGLLNQPTSDDQ